MIPLVVIWTFLVLLCHGHGLWLLQVLNLSTAERSYCEYNTPAKFIVSTWMGAVSLSAILLALSLFFPLSPPVFYWVSVILGGISAFSPSTRRALNHYRRTFSLSWLAGWVTLLIFVAFISTAQVTFYDAGLYHFQLIRWLSEFGTTSGLALLHSRFGFTSAWFALAAPFDAGWLDARAATITGGFVLLLSISHVAISVQNVVERSDRVSDWFLIIATFIYLPYLVNWRLAISSSPDVPVTALIVETAWLMLVIANVDREKTTASSSGQATEQIVEQTPEQSTGQIPELSVHRPNIAILPVILSAGAMTIKLSALPLALGSIVFYGFQSFPIKALRIAKGLAIAALIVMPLLLANLKSSGCPLYPSPLFCTTLPWSVGAEQADTMSALIQDWARWIGPIPENAEQVNWLVRWLTIQREATLLIGASLFSAAVLWFVPGQKKTYGKLALVALALMGIAFMLYKAPGTRFGLGFLAILPSLLIALVVQVRFALGIFLFLALCLIFYALQMNKLDGALMLLTSTMVLYLGFLTVRLNQKENKPAQFILLPLLLAIVALFPTSPYLRRTGENLQRVVLPPSVQVPTFTRVEADNFVYYKPLESDQCWAAPIPCTPYLAGDDVRLRKIGLGLKGGFRRQLQ